MMTRCRKGSKLCVGEAEVSNHTHSACEFFTVRGRECNSWEAGFGTNGRPDALRGLLWCHFEMIWGHFGGTLGPLWISLASLYVYECDFKIILRDFQIIFIVP